MIDTKGKAIRIYAVLTVLIYLVMVVNVPNAQAQQASINWYSMEEAQRLAEKNDKKVLAYAVKTWCVYCKKMDEKVFPEQAVIDSLNAYFYPVRINLDSEEEIVFNGKKITPVEFAKTYNLRATPTIVFLSEGGSIMGSQPGYIPAEMFSQLLAFMGSEAFQKMDFKMYLQQTVKAGNK